MTRLLEWTFKNRLTVIFIFAVGSVIGLYAVSITPVDPTKEAKVLPGQLVTTSSSVLFPVTFAEFSDPEGNVLGIVKSE